nr:MAG TPA: hypothetical protein [Caudoviricetes sp.]
MPQRAASAFTARMIRVEVSSSLIFGTVQIVPYMGL